MGVRLKVGLFFLVAIGTLFASCLWLSQVKLFSHSYRFQIAFEDVYGLTVRSRVQLLGVRIGRVARIRMQPEVVLVDVEIDDPSIRIPIDSAMTIGSYATGGKYVDVIPLSTSLYPERTVGPGMTVLGVSPTHLDSQFEKVQYQLSVMRAFLEDPKQQAFIEEQIQGAISLAERFSNMADRTLAMTSGKVTQVDSLDALAARKLPGMVVQLQQLRKQAQGMLETGRSLRLMGHTLDVRGQVMLLRMRTLTIQAQGMVDRLQNGGQVHSIGPKVRAALASMRHMLNDIDSLLNLVKPSPSARPSPRPSPAGVAPVASAAPGLHLPEVAK